MPCGARRSTRRSRSATRRSTPVRQRLADADRPGRAARAGRGARPRRRQGRVRGAAGGAGHARRRGGARGGAGRAPAGQGAPTPREKASYLAQVTKLVRAQGEGQGKHGEEGAGQPGAGRRRAQDPGLPGGSRGGADAARVRARQAPARAACARRRSSRCASPRAARPGARVAAALHRAGRDARPPSWRARRCTRWPASRSRARWSPRLKKLALGARGRARAAGDRAAGADRDAARGADALAGVLTATAGPHARRGGGQRARARVPKGALALARALLAMRDGERAALLARLLRPRLRALTEGGAAGRSWPRRCSRTRWPASATASAARRAAAARARDRSRRGRRPACARWRASCRSARTASARWRCCGWSGTPPTRRPTTATRWPPPSCAPGGATRRWRSCSSSSTAASTWRRALRRDRQLSPEQRYQVGFILVERRHPAGEEILTDLAGSGRSKIATMAKAKLKSARATRRTCRRGWRVRPASPAPPAPPPSCRSGSARRRRGAPRRRSGR